MAMKDPRCRIEAALGTIAEMVAGGKLPETLGAITMLSRASDAPSARWSAGNQALMVASGTMDARGYQQWRAVGRQVRRGAKAIYILAPRTITKTEIDEETGEEITRKGIVGFTATPVFRVEDTEGEPLPDYDPPTLPPLYGAAKALGVSVAYAPPAGAYYGYYEHGRGQIVLATHDELTWWHELAHAAHYHLAERAATPGEAERARKEIVAEWAAAALAHLYGRGSRLAASAGYIRHYAGGTSPAAALRQMMRYFAEAKAVIELILATADQEEAA